MNFAEHTLEYSIRNMVDRDPERALSILAGSFVALMCAMTEARGGNPYEVIVLDSMGTGRNITIHPQESVQ